MLIVPLGSAAAAEARSFGPKAANLAALGQAGLPVPGGFCVSAQAYWLQLESLSLGDLARRATVEAGDRPAELRRRALQIRLALYDRPLAPALLDALLTAWRTMAAASAAPGVVRSSALVEDRFGSSFAGQFESYLGLQSEEEFLTAVRSCWAALWSTRVLRYMEGNSSATPGDTAMAILVQPLVQARCSGGGLSRTANGDRILTATWGLGSAIAQGEVVPDRIVLRPDGTVRDSQAGRKYHRVTCSHGSKSVPRSLFAAPCLDTRQSVELGAMLIKAEQTLGQPVEIEWALDEAGFKLLQARPLPPEMQATEIGDRAAAGNEKVWLHHPRLQGQPAGIGWGAGRACVVNCECELSRVGPGDILVTRVAGPALSSILSRVAGVVAELGGSTSHLASLARERGIPMVLGVLDATERIPDGVHVAVDGVAGVVQWIR